MGNTLIISFYKLLFGFPAPILLALLLNEMRFMRAKKCIQTISYVPYFISWVIVASLLNSILTTDNGLVNVVLNKLGFRSISFMKMCIRDRERVLRLATIREGLTFDDVLLVPQHSNVLPREVAVSYTHLDVYKRQAGGMQVVDQGFDFKPGFAQVALRGGEQRVVVGLEVDPPARRQKGPVLFELPRMGQAALVVLGLFVPRVAEVDVDALDAVRAVERVVDEHGVHGRKAQVVDRNLAVFGLRVPDGNCEDVAHLVDGDQVCAGVFVRHARGGHALATADLQPDRLPTGEQLLPMAAVRARRFDVERAACDDRLRPRLPPHSHGLDVYKRQSVLMCDYPMPLAETASIFNETLLMEKTLETAGDATKLTLLEQQIGDAAQVVVDILSRYLFETEVVERRKDHPLSPRELCAIMLEAQKRCV